MDGPDLVTTVEGLDQIIGLLRESGRVVVGPTVRDGVITHDEIHDTSDLPKGWGDAQSPGAYRLVRTGNDELFGFSSPSESWKRFVYPARTLLIRAHRTEHGVEVEPPPLNSPPVAFFGIRSCDLAGMGVLDRVLGESADHPDADYEQRRNDAFIVAVGCSRPSQTCFCASMNTGPNPTAGYDLAISELAHNAGPRYLVTTGSERGATLLSGIGRRVGTQADRTLESEQYERAVAAMTRRIDPADPPHAAENLEHPQWTDIADRCLACGNCTMVCPTCFCSTTEDSTSLDGTEAERSRVWDSCFTLGFSYMHGGSARTSTKSRYRQWLLHKLVTWHDQFGTSGCVGCGRCITWCPVGIDLTAEIALLADSQAAEGTPS